ncbi:MAG: E3 ubiquitin-protein ligase synoviolin [Marteilia pararefringens]
MLLAVRCFRRLFFGPPLPQQNNNNDQQQQQQQIHPEQQQQQPPAAPNRNNSCHSCLSTSSPTLKLNLVIFASTIAFLASLSHIYFSVGRQNLYSSWQILIKSKLHKSILVWFTVCIIFVMLKSLAFIFFGGLRPIEFEHLIEKTSVSITDTFILLMLMHAQLSSSLIKPFLILYLSKWTKWLLNDRLSFLESRLNIPLIDVIRTIVCLMLALVCDLVNLAKYLPHIASMNPNVNCALLLEYFLESVESLRLLYSYFLFAYETHVTDDSSFNKQLLILYGNLFGVASSLLAQVLFFTLLVHNYIFPFISIRSFMVNLSNFRKYLKTIVHSRRAIRIMESQFADVTQQELEQYDSTCIICREDMGDGAACKRLPCSHILHSDCLKSWFQRQQACPLCRTHIFSSSSSSNNQNSAGDSQRQQQQQQQAAPLNNNNRVNNNDRQEINQPLPMVIEENQQEELEDAQELLNGEFGSEAAQQLLNSNNSNNQPPNSQRSQISNNGRSFENNEMNSSNNHINDNPSRSSTFMRRRNLSQHSNQHSANSFQVQNQANSNEMPPNETGATSQIATNSHQHSPVGSEIELFKTLLLSLNDTFNRSTMPYNVKMPNFPENLANLSDESLKNLEKEMSLSIHKRLIHLSKIRHMISGTESLMRAYDNSLLLSNQFRQIQEQKQDKSSRSEVGATSAAIKHSEAQRSSTFGQNKDPSQIQSIDSANLDEKQISAFMNAESRVEDFESQIEAKGDQKQRAAACCDELQVAGSKTIGETKQFATNASVYEKFIDETTRSVNAIAELDNVPQQDN